MKEIMSDPASKKGRSRPASPRIVSYKPELTDTSADVKKEVKSEDHRHDHVERLQRAVVFKLFREECIRFKRMLLGILGRAEVKTLDCVGILRGNYEMHRYCHYSAGFVPKTASG
jgi:hypothetical protein